MLPSVLMGESVRKWIEVLPLLAAGFASPVALRSPSNGAPTIPPGQWLPKRCAT